MLTSSWAPGGGGGKMVATAPSLIFSAFESYVSCPEFPAKSRSVSVALIRLCACPQTYRGGQGDAML